MPQVWGLAHFSSKNGLQHGIFPEACAASLASNPNGTQRGRCEGDAMQALMVTIKIKAGHRDAFMEAMLSDARGSVHDEPGCLRFDVLQDAKEPNTIYLYEVYRDEAAIEAHRQALHFVKWRETVKDWFDGDLVVHQCSTVFPSESAWEAVKPRV